MTMSTKWKTDLEFEENVIIKVEKDSLELDNGFNIYYDFRSNKPTPKVGDKIKIFGKGIGRPIRGVQINGNIIWYKTQKEMDRDHLRWISKIKREYMLSYEKLMDEIKDETEFMTIDISGFGGGYERGCQMGLRAGEEWLKQHPDFKFDYRTYKNITGICFCESDEAKELDETISNAVDGGMTGAQHQAIIAHLFEIKKKGREQWLNSYKGRQYKYPSGLPKPSFGCEGEDNR